MNHIKKFNEGAERKSKADEILDYYLIELEGKYNFKVVNSPSIIQRGDYVSYGNVTRKGAYTIRFEVINKIDNIIEFLNDINRVNKRWKLKDSFYKIKERGNKIQFYISI